MSQVRFEERDTTLRVQFLSPEDPQLHQVKNEILELFFDNNWSVGLDPVTQQYYPSSIAQNYHHGKKGGLEVKMALTDASIEVKFFQNIVFENKRGGEFDDDRLAKMPYLVRKAYELIRFRLAFVVYGITGAALVLDVEPDGMALVLKRRYGCPSVKGTEILENNRPQHQPRSARGKKLQDGDFVAFYDKIEFGRLLRGQAWRGTADRWMVLLPCGDVCQVESSKLIHASDITRWKGRYVPPIVRARKIHEAKAVAIGNGDYARAARLREAINTELSEREAA